MWRVRLWFPPTSCLINVNSNQIQKGSGSRSRYQPIMWRHEGKVASVWVQMHQVVLRAAFLPPLLLHLLVVLSSFLDHLWPSTVFRIICCITVRVRHVVQRWTCVCGPSEPVCALHTSSHALLASRFDNLLHFTNGSHYAGMRPQRLVFLVMSHTPA